MARINRYEEDDSISLDDKVIGSDREGAFGTKNYSLAAILNLFRNALPNIDPPITRTSELINDGDDNTSTYVENDEIGATATSNDYNDLDNKPNISPTATKTSELTNDGADNTSTYVEHDEIGDTATSNDYNDLDNKPDGSLSYISVTTSRNLSDSDNGKVLVVQNSGITLTALTILPSGFNCCVTPQTGYDATIAGGVGVTFDDPSGLDIAENEMISIGRIGDEFIIRP